MKNSSQDKTAVTRTITIMASLPTSQSSETFKILIRRTDSLKYFPMILDSVSPRSLLKLDGIISTRRMWT